MKLFLYVIAALLGFTLSFAVGTLWHSLYVLPELIAGA